MTPKIPNRMTKSRKGHVTRAQNIARCTAGLLRFATPAEMDALLGHLPAARVRHALHSHGTPNRVVAEAVLRRGRREELDRLVDDALLNDGPPTLLGRLLDLDDPETNASILGAEGGLTRIPRNLRRQLAHQTSRRDGVTPVPLPEGMRELLMAGHRTPEPLDHALLHAQDPDLAGTALRFLGAGADPHGAVRACRTLLDAGRGHEIRDLVARGLLPADRWGPDGSEPSVLAYAQAAISGEEGARRLRELSERVRRPELLRTVAELADTGSCEPWRGDPPLVRTVVNRRHPGIPRVDWHAVLEDEPRRRAAEGPLPYRAAGFMARRTDLPLELSRMVAADHPELAVFISDPAPEVLADLCGQGARPGAEVLLKVVGNGLVAGTLTPEGVVATLPEEVLDVVAESLWLPAARGTAEIRALLGRSGDVALAPFFVDETGHGRRRLRDPAKAAHWDPARAYGAEVAGLRRLREGPPLSADDVLDKVEADAVLAPTDGLPDPRVLRRLAEHVHEHLGGRPEAWLVALKLLEDGFVGSLRKLLVIAGTITR
ncbi:hypothetical protein GCM10023085_81610 [Actinomadura viridis]|uniref:Uncharacterized protein n=1 Tax=Actinomadura viridis TaxID=58110 RepID=A0A931GI35_9ACTN|nr:hypothetical protein [Actinomadura viridis]MBG6088128.1 hypothetical protein [Actinomadura viridis]